MSKDLTIKQRRFLEVYIETGNATEAAMQAYDCKDRKSAKSLGNSILTKLDNEAINIKMDAAGLTDELLMLKLHEGLYANTVIVAKHQGAILDEKSYIDHPTRARFTELALKLKGKLTEKHIHTVKEPTEIRIL